MLFPAASTVARESSQFIMSRGKKRMNLLPSLTARNRPSFTSTSRNLGEQLAHWQSSFFVQGGPPKAVNGSVRSLYLGISNEYLVLDTRDPKAIARGTWLRA